MKQSQGESFVSDSPVKDPERDLFRRWPFAKRVAKVIASRSDPSSIVIGINGAWGEGKTSVLNFIEHELTNQSHIVTFRFNPWQFGDETKLLLGFFNSLAEAVGKSMTSNKEKAGDWISKYGTVAASFFGQGDTVRELGSTLASVEIEDLRKRVEGILREEGKRVVVLMDDIDRLDKNEVQAVFRILKITADFDYTAYVLAFDDQMVAAALQERYSSTHSDAGKNFLEKIVQIPLAMPVISKRALREYFFYNIDQALKDAEIELSENQIQSFLRSFIQSLEIRLKTPRLAKRYSNIVSFSLPILKGEVNVVDLMLIEGVRIMYPDLYDVIRSNPDIFLGHIFNRNASFEQQKQRAIEVLARGTNNLQDTERRAVNELISTLFPRTNIIFGKIQYGEEWERNWGREQRICSSTYFPRYFSYSVSESEISDRELSEFMHKISGMSMEEITDYLQIEVGKERAANFISQIRPRHNELSNEVARSMALALAANGDLFPQSQQLFSFLGVFSQAAMLIANLVRTLPAGTSRFELAKEVISIAEPLTFAIEINHWLPIGETEEEKLYSNEEESEIHKAITERIKQTLLGEVTIFDLFPNSVSMILSTWARYSNNDEPSNYVKDLINRNPDFPIQLLIAYTPTAWGLETGLSSKSDFDRRQYEIISELVDPEDLFKALTNTESTIAQVTHFPRNYNLPLADRVTQQFIWLHNHLPSSDTKNGSVEPQEDE